MKNQLYLSLNMPMNEKVDLDNLTNSDIKKLKQFLFKISNPDSVKWKNYRLVFDKFRTYHPTKSQFLSVKQKSKQCNITTVFAPPMKGQNIVPDSTFRDVVNELKDLGLIICEGQAAILNFELIEKIQSL